MERARVLVAEPDELQRQLIDLLLSVDTFDVTAAAPGQEALAHLRENTPDVILAAVELPDIDGYALCRKTKVVGRLAKVPVVLLAGPRDGGVLDEATRAAARAAGADLLLPRPLGDKNLRERLLRLMRPGEARGVDVGGGNGQAEAADTAATAAFGATNPGLTSSGVQAATELGGLRAEVAQLRAETASLKARRAQYKELARTLQDQLDEERRKPRGLFGRRG